MADVPSEPQAPQDAEVVRYATHLEAIPPGPPSQPVTLPGPEPAETRFLKALLFGSKGVRVGWLAVLFLLLTTVLIAILTVAAFPLMNKLHVKPGQFTARAQLVSELLQVLALTGAAAIMARIERRKLLDYYLRGTRRLRHFFSGLAGGMIALSALVGILYAGGWLHFGPISPLGLPIAIYFLLWALTFLFTGLSEEGTFRCYLLFTLTRGINYWWALGSISAFCLFAAINHSGSGAGGVYAMALAGLVPCLLLHLRKSPSAGFWQAAWLTSTLFGYVHTFNKGETWIGIFSAALIGFIFCVSVRLTGSAWWAIGFHAAWDWAQTFFYGTPDSGFQPQGHYLTTSPVGPEFWSGGSDGPEGSVLVIPVVLLTLAILVLVYRSRTGSGTSPDAPFNALS